MSPTNPDTARAAVGIKLGLLYAADDDLSVALAHTPSEVHAEIQSLAAKARQHIHAITGEPLR
jgi:hypothetical protein